MLCLERWWNLGHKWCSDVECVIRWSNDWQHGCDCSLKWKIFESLLPYKETVAINAIFYSKSAGTFKAFKAETVNMAKRISQFVMRIIAKIICSVLVNAIPHITLPGIYLKKGQEKGKRQVTGLACVLPVADLSPLLAYHALFCFVFKKKEALETSRLACWQPGWAAGSHQVARGSAQLLGIEYVHTCS